MGRAGTNSVTGWTTEPGRRHKRCPAGLLEPDREGGRCRTLRGEGVGVLGTRGIRETRVVCVMCSKFSK